MHRCFQETPLPVTKRSRSTTTFVGSTTINLNDAVHTSYHSPLSRFMYAWWRLYIRAERHSAPDAGLEAFQLARCLQQSGDDLGHVIEAFLCSEQQEGLSGIIRQQCKDHLLLLLPRAWSPLKSN
ncbi:hypothetical protein CVIRNUC_002151 [Coccomyxa viridis]|uniref:Uncharacterized protein n=1 Tax=Coccomyxa viridis TaxID=1274662 RepID=A0AAV1HUX4_9CHLO|nr:hypothetical protein CVIRNUC_002151 [Coccomyxa viridis]